MRISNNFIAAVEHSRLSILDNIVTMDETMISYYTPETKRMSKEWTLKGKPGPLKAKVQASRSKQMVFAFFDIVQPHLHAHRPQERHHQWGLRRGCPGQVLEEFAAEEAEDDVPAVVIPLG